MKLATLIYVQHEGKTLMIHRNKKENDIHEWKRNGVWWKLEPGESPDECCVRELLEETWLLALEYSLKWILSAPEFTPWHDWYIFIYMVTCFEGELIDCNEWELHWINNDSLLDLNLWEWDRKFIPLLFQKWFLRIKMNYQWWEFIDSIIAQQFAG